MRIVLGCLLALTLIAGCGGDDDEQAVRAAVERYVSSARAHDNDALCRDLIAQELKQMFKDAGADCTGFVDADMGRDFRFTVDRVWLNDDRAMAIGTSVVKGEKDEERMPLVKEKDGQWRLTLKPPAGVDPTMNADQQAVAKAGLRYAELARAGDYRRICDELAARELKDELASISKDCARDYFAKQPGRMGKRFTFNIGEVRIKGAHAMAIGQADAGHGALSMTLELVREGDEWRITG